VADRHPGYQLDSCCKHRNLGFGKRSLSCLATQVPFRDDKRVLECLQKALRIASSCIDEAASVQLYVEALDHYIYYFEQGAEAVSGSARQESLNMRHAECFSEQVTPKYINSLTELIVGNIDLLGQSDGDFPVRPMDRTRNPQNSIQVRYSFQDAERRLMLTHVWFWFVSLAFQ